MNRDLARGRALALRLMDGFDAELAEIEAALGEPLPRARELRDGWRAGEPGDLFIARDEVELFAAEIATARHTLLGPDHRPCPFDPYHPSATVRARWTPPGSPVRPVTCCPDDARLLATTGVPRARLLTSLSGYIPLWEGDDLAAFWLRGHHAPTGVSTLTEVFHRTPVAHYLHLR